jgi:preprotein translocase subunit YajC
MTSPALHVVVAAQQAAPSGGGGLDGPFFLMMGTIFAIFYFLVLRPQQKKQRTLEASVKSAAKGDQVVTAGGLHGKIFATEEDVVTLEIATVKGGQPVRVQVSRSRIESVASRKSADGSSKDGAKDASKEKGKDGAKDASKEKAKKGDGS